MTRNTTRSLFVAFLELVQERDEPNETTVAPADDSPAHEDRSGVHEVPKPGVAKCARVVPFRLRKVAL
jgi:hypothetical protein